MTVYSVLKYVHVLLAIVAIGFNLSYGVWLRRSMAEPEHAAYVLKGIKFLDDRFATPAYILLLLTGFGLVYLGDIPLTTFWILGSLVLYGGVVVGGMIFYSPTLKKQTELASSGRAGSDIYRRLANRGLITGAAILLIVIAIEFLMVIKPTI